jgi:hypothetical protein
MAITTNRMRRKMKGEREARVGDETWGFRMGRQNVVIVTPDGRKSFVDFVTLTGRSWGTLERGQWKGTSDGMVTPEHVKRYIRKHRDTLLAHTGVTR